MEEDEETPKSIPPWVELEYSHMRILAGHDSTVHFTNLSEASRASLSDAFAKSHEDGLAGAQCHREGIIKVLQEKTGSVSLETVCLLDPKAEKELSPEDGDGRFTWFLFGVSDDPPRDRTAELRKLGFPARRLGPIQMTTDTALGVTKIVVVDKKPIDKIPYVDMPTIRFNAKESVEMPFRYIAHDGEPILPPGMRELLHEDLNKSFDF
ncbi:SAM-dependent RNA methyltransferase [Schizophyllum fasciatum]